MSPLPTTNSQPLFPRPGQLRPSVRFGNGVMVDRLRRATVPDGPFWQIKLVCTRGDKVLTLTPKLPQRARRNARRRAESISNPIIHYLNGRFVNVVGIYTAPVWRNKVFGSGSGNGFWTEWAVEPITGRYTIADRMASSLTGSHA